MTMVQKEKQHYVERLSEIICQNNNFKSLSYSVENGVEIVTITCNNDYEYKVDVTADSIIAMTKDIAVVMLKHS